MLTVGDIAKWMDEWYPPHEAAEWDRVGLIVGSREAPVAKVMLAVDPVEVTGRQAIDMGADMIITHHPLYLRGTSFVSEDNAKGRLVANLIRNGVGGPHWLRAYRRPGRARHTCPVRLPRGKGPPGRTQRVAGWG